MKHHIYARISSRISGTSLEVWALVTIMRFKGSRHWAPRARVLAGYRIRMLPFRPMLIDNTLSGHQPEGLLLAFSKSAWASMTIEPVEQDELPQYLDSFFTTDWLHDAIRGDHANNRAILAQ